MCIFFIVSDYHSIDLFAQPGWITQQSGTGNDLYSVSFVDTNRGMAVGANGIILGTTNGGETWIQQISNTSAILYGVTYIDNNTVIAVGSSGTITRSTDNGANWFNQESGTTLDLHAVSFNSVNNGTAVGGLATDSGIVLHTTNGGIIWIRQTIPTTKSLYGVKFTDDNNGTAVGYYQPGGTILHTTDGGLHWVSQSADPNTDFLYSVSFANSQVGMAVGLFSTAIKTTDAGTTWTNFYPVNRSQHLNGVFLSDPDNAVIVGYGVIVKTTDGGASWIEENTEAVLTSVFFSDLLHGTTVGSNGVILHTTNGGITSADKRKKISMIYELLQNFPNPFNPSTTISFSLPQSQNVELKVFDMLGNEVALLLDEYKSAGEHKIEFNGSELSTGIYFYQMKAGDFIKTKKLVLLK